MKKSLLITSIILLTTISLNAQIEYGVKSGFYYSEREANISFSDDGLNNAKNYNSGFYISVFAEIKVIKNLYLQPEISYVVIENDFNQIQIPVLAKYGIGKKFKVFAGPNLGFLLNANENFQTVNFTLTAGVSYDITKKFSIELRRNFAASNSLKDNIGLPAISSIKFNSSQIGLSYKFN